MPKILDWRGYKYFFYANEGKPLERPHIHVRKGKNVAKYWLEPEVTLASSWGLNSKELNLLEKQVENNINLFRSRWDEYFS